jgi:hypothetical protein
MMRMRIRMRLTYPAVAALALVAAVGGFFGAGGCSTYW